MLDNGDGTSNNEGSEDAGEEDVDGVGDQPGKQQQSGQVAVITFPREQDERNLDEVRAPRKSPTSLAIRTISHPWHMVGWLSWIFLDKNLVHTWYPCWLTRGNAKCGAMRRARLPTREIT